MNKILLLLFLAILSALFVTSVMTSFSTAKEVSAIQSTPEIVVTEKMPPALADDLFVASSLSGAEKITIRCSNGVTGEQWVNFGLPFPRGNLESADKIRIETTDGIEIPSNATVLAYWRHFKTDAKDGKWIRSALIVFNHDCTNANTAEYRFRWGVKRNLNAVNGINPRNVYQTWQNQSPPEPGEHPATDNYNVDDLAPVILEPKVWVSLPAQWLASSNIRGPVNINIPTDIKNYRINFAKTYVNDVALDVTQFENNNGQGLINWKTEVEGWLYDRPLSLADMYIFTGEEKWLRHTHRAAQFYASWVSLDNAITPYKRGHFRKTVANDLKYSLNGGLFAAYLLTGDARLLDRITAIADYCLTAFDTRLMPFTKTTGLWTERNLSATISGLTYGYEATGNVAYKNRLLAIIAGMVTDVKTPPPGYPANMEGILFHRFEVHEGTSRAGWYPDLFMSPWMSALLCESLWRYFMLSDDIVALEFISDYAKFVAEKGIFSSTMTDPFTNGPSLFYAAYYGLGQYKKWDWEGIFTQREHGFDVAGLLARGRWASMKLGRSTVPEDTNIPRLFRTGKSNFPYWTRSTAGLPRSRVSPTRKFAWWFGSTHDYYWLAPPS